MIEKQSMRDFAFITVGRILLELNQGGLNISRPTFYRLEKRLSLPPGRRTSAIKSWRVYSEEDSSKIKTTIRKEYGFDN